MNIIKIEPWVSNYFCTVCSLISICMTFGVVCILDPLERARVIKEYFNNWYKLKTYYMAMTVSSIPVQVSDTFISKLFHVFIAVIC
jgi:hypothetical protein